ncbi:MAG: hypothetical protein KME49_03725 [Brasilonema octagenarum HA4186-MV1]|jgi:sRNA-binding carbon storage regulator CsrA|uniref:Bacteriocin n=1 Tax=Brasilonema sennae CENA114 TaxID=415709 RepID=A0A856MBK3_9CYAN|nr:hypothetical protein [Brasilonema sennae]MBW4624631.1 hypothetical protein [Brasilonema octagenarum HA4186-MV1]QDL08543.1 hypothetical protein DP114_12150 [Brasilonema sennae CENA114]QDL14898.1 hypothetical protein DP113_12085 [Brasilonema octagenarum UFV-E1]
MSTLKFEQETFTVLTELTDEEINGIVGGKGSDVAIGVKAPTNVKIDGATVTTQQITQVGVALVVNGDGKASVKQDATQKVIQTKRRP